MWFVESFFFGQNDLLKVEKDIYRSSHVVEYNYRKKNFLKSLIIA